MSEVDIYKGISEKRKQQMKEYNRNHREKVRIAQRKYYESHKDYYKQYNRTRFKELQQEIERLNEENEKIRKQNLYEHKYGSDMEGKYIIEKAKNDKAVEYIENTPLYTETYDYNMEDNLELNYVSDEKAHNDLLNILRGEK